MPLTKCRYINQQSNSVNLANKMNPFFAQVLVYILAEFALDGTSVSCSLLSFSVY